MSLATVRDLELAYGKKRVVGPVTFDIHRGESLALIGESGAGKSTLAYEILGLLSFKGGRRISGTVHREISAEKIAYIPQDPLAALDPLFSIGYQMAEIRPDQGRIKTALSRARLSLEKISLKSYPHELSGGMRQRLVIAMALLREPELIVADEPTSSLDLILQSEIVQLFNDIRAAGTSFLIVTHNLPFAARCSDRAVVLQQGLIRESGEIPAIFRAPKNSYTKILVQSVPRMVP